VDLVLPLILSGVGVAVATAAFLNRDKPEWKRSMPALMVLAVSQVLLGTVAWILLNR
jgi:hypothetical protein